MQSYGAIACSRKSAKVQMESTSISWVPLYDLLEQHGITPCLVNAHHVKTVPGRKSDWNDAQWLQQLHSLGLLRASFRPDQEICTLRTLVRHRAQLIEHRAPHILHMQQALKQMNIQLSVVLTDITGTTGQAILRAIVAGEHDPVCLAQRRRPGCTSSEETIAKALTPTWQEAQLFVLQQALALYDYYTEQIVACDTEIARVYATMEARHIPETPMGELACAKPNAKSKNTPTFNARAQLARVVGVDRVAVTGLSAAPVQTILSEIGTDMNKFPTVKHFCSWLGLAPRNDISGGKVLRSRTMKVVRRAAQAFRNAAQSVARSNSTFGAFFRTLRGRLGPQQAIVATAHKIARVVYHLLKTHESFHDEGATAYEANRQERELKRLTQRAHKLGYTLTPAPESSGAPSDAS